MSRLSIQPGFRLSLQENIPLIQKRGKNIHLKIGQAVGKAVGKGAPANQHVRKQAEN